jgi:hypothetical protein
LLLLFDSCFTLKVVIVIILWHFPMTMTIKQ